MNLEFTHFSINCLAGLLSIGFLVGLFFFNRTVISWLLFGFFGGVMSTSSYLFFIYCLQERATPALEHIHFFCLSISSICLLQIPYKLSPRDRRRESTIVLYLSVIAHIYVLIYVWLFIESEPTMNFESHMLAFKVTHVERSNLVFIAEYFLALWLFLRNTLEQEPDNKLSTQKGTKKRIRPGAFSWVRKLVMPKNDQAIANRNSALLLICCIVVWIVLSIANYGYTSHSNFSWVVNAIALVMLLFYIVSYINWFEKKSKLMAKLLAISLVFIIVIISHIGYFSTNQREKSYDSLKRMELGFLKQQVPTRSFTGLSDDLGFIVAGPIDNDPYNKAAYELVYSRSDGFELDRLLTEEKMIREHLRQLPTGTPSRDYHLRWTAYVSGLKNGIFQGKTGFNYLGRRAEASNRFVLFDFIQADRLFRVGYRYTAYRSFVNDTAEVFVWLLLLAATLVIIGFPVLFHVNLVKPLRALLVGVKRVNAGDFDSYVKVTFNDEVGFLTQSFNRMALSIKDHTLHLESKVKERTREIEGLNALKRRFLAIVAHDLRSPLKTIEFSIDKISGRIQADHEQRRNLGTITESVSYMFQILEDLSDLTMIEAGKIHLEYSENDYPAFVGRNLEAKRHRAQSRGIELRLVSCEPVPKIFFDKTKMNQVLDNLIENAITHSAENTEIKIEIEPRKKVVLTKITDQGSGIAEQDLPDVFNEYQTSSGSLPSQSKRSGLGLAIVKKIIHAHHGEVGIESRVGHGTTVFFKLPVHED